ncbi:uncharacterized protein LOC134274100 [Saccostrea cucullata]|uniref:uncharacterized protein LOC134274100 n=1 Tax=Saccostrea cuccullata TaxID=36930 RepID=UPI002ED65B9D
MAEPCEPEIKYFVKTKLYKMCKSQLEEKRVAIIIGEACSGKTTYARRLFEEEKNKMKNRTCLEVTKPEEIDFVRGTQAVLFFDNIFGQYVENIELTLAWSNRMKNLADMVRRVTLILTSRSDIYHKCKNRKGFGFLDEFVVEISCKELNSVEEANIASSMGLTSFVKTQLSDLNLLQQCEVWGAGVTLLQKEGITNVSTASVNEYFESLKKTSKLRYCSLLLSLVHNNKLRENDLEKESTVEILKTIGQDVGKKSVNKTKATLQDLSHSLLKIRDCEYSFANSTLFHLASRFFVKQHPDVFVRFSSTECLETLSPLFDTVNEIHIQTLSETLAGEYVKMIQTKSFNVLKNERTLREFLFVMTRDKKLDLFLKCDFFWYVCWSDSLLLLEMLLRKMSGRKEIIRNCLDCCSDHIKSVLQRFLEREDHPEEILSPTNFMQPPYELAFRKVSCRGEDFPRFHYHCELILELEESLMHLISQNSQLQCIDFVPWSQTKATPVIYVVGKNLTQTKLSFISKEERKQENMRRQKDVNKKHEMRKPQYKFVDFKERIPSCFVFFCDEQDTVGTVSESLKMVTDEFSESEFAPIGPFVVIVLTPEGEIWTVEALQTYCRANAHIITATDIQTLRKHVTSTLEIMLIEYLRLVQKSLSSFPSSEIDDISIIQTETEAILNRLHKASSLPTSITKLKTSVVSMSITEECQKILDRNPDKVFAYGFRPGTFYVQVSGHLTEEQFQLFRKELLHAKKISNFSWEMTVEKIDSFKINRYLCQGNEIYPDKGNIERYGTLGGFAEFSDDSKRTVALTCSHVLQDKKTVHVKDGSELICIGKCCLMYEYFSDSADFALIEVNDDVIGKCQKLLVNHKKIPTSARIYMMRSSDTVPSIVYKKGAKTDITKGVLVETKKYRDTLGEEKMNCAYLVQGQYQKGVIIPFGDKGDSGSLVFQNDFDVDQNIIEVIAILIGDFEVRADDSNAEASNSPNKPKPGLKLCTSLEFVCDKLKKSKRQLRFFDKAEVNCGIEERDRQET